MTLGTPNTLPNFKCKNITIKSSASEKLLGVIIDNELDSTKHLNTVCRKANLKLHALENLQIFVSRAARTNNRCLYKISFQLLPVGLDVLLQGVDG